MLNIVRSSKSGMQYALFTEGNAIEGLTVYITNGEVLWKNEDKVTDNNRPPSRSQENSEGYLIDLMSALATNNIGSESEGRFFYDIQETAQNLSLIIKEKVSGTSSTLTLLLKLILSLITSDTDNPLLIMFQRLNFAFSELVVEVKTMKNVSDADKAIITTLSSDLDLLTAFKDTVQDTMVQKMCMILNTKKIEINRLRAELHDLKAQYKRNEAVMDKEESIRGKRAIASDKNEVKFNKRKATKVDGIQSKISRKLKRNQVESSEAEDEGEDSAALTEDILMSIPLQTNTIEVNGKDIMTFLSQSQQSVEKSSSSSSTWTTQQAVSQPSQQSQQQAAACSSSSSSSSSAAASGQQVRKKKSELFFEQQSDDDHDDNNCLSYL
jgi:hypothetical protein